MCNDECDKCSCDIFNLGDTYLCPICLNKFCYDCIEKHGCRVEIYPIGSKFNYVRGVENE